MKRVRGNYIPVVVAIGGVLMACSPARSADRPNLVVILSDDFGYGSAGCYGADGKLVQTPNLDRLAVEGRRFTDANTTSSVCSPTRYSVLTGRYCWRTSEKHGVLGTYSPLHIEPDRLTLASMLKKHGYRTAAIGKWHLGYGSAGDSPAWKTDYRAELSPGPLDIGFDYHFGVPSNHGDLTGIYVENRHVFGLRGAGPAGAGAPDPGDPDFKESYTAEDTEGARSVPIEIDAPRRVNERVMPHLTRRACEWIEASGGDDPFFLYFTPVAVHNPVTPDADLAGSSKAGPYGDWIHELDRSVGKILDALDRKGIADKTLVIFSSDNGGVFKPEREMLQTDAFRAGLKVNGDLRGGKHTVWQGGFTVPFLARWPGRIPPGTVCDGMISLADLLATTAAIVGEPLPEAGKGAEDSVNQLPALLGDADGARADMIVHSSDGVFAIRKGPWKWIEGEPAAGAKKRQSDEFREQLYDVEADPAETRDVSAEHPEVVAGLRALLDRYREGAYSREMPPLVEKKIPLPAILEPLKGKTVLEAALGTVPGTPWQLRGGEWTIADGALRGESKGAKASGATLRVPVRFRDAVLDYEIRFDGADRHSLRVEAGTAKRSFRVEMSRVHAGVTKNPEPGEDRSAAQPLARKSHELGEEIWYPVRIRWAGDSIRVQVNETVIEATHEILAEEKAALNFLVFEGAAGLRNVRLVQPEP